MISRCNDNRILWYGAVALGLIGGCAAPSAHVTPAKDTPKMIQTGFLDQSISLSDGSTRRYVIFIPRAYDPSKKWPAILFLHGAGERGEDNQVQVKVGLGPVIRRQENQFGFITVLPQSAPQAWWTHPKEKEYALAALEKTRKDYSIDPRRIYLTGLSMGGAGTWALAADQPQTWAAIAPICGPADPTAAPKVVHLPCWCFHGQADDTVKVAQSQKMIEALKSLGGQPRYTEYPGVGHNSWDRAYGTAELFSWFLANPRKL